MSENKNTVVKLSGAEFEENLKTALLIEKQYADKLEELKEKIEKELKKKNLNTNLIMELLNSDYYINKLELKEKMAICKALYENTTNEYVRRVMNPKKYFSDADLLSYENTVMQEEYKNKIIKFENFRQVNDHAWLGDIDVYQIFDLINNRELRYNFDIQREAKYKKTSKGIRKEITKNEKSIEEIKELFLENKYEPDTIVFNVPLLDNKNPNISIEDTALQDIVTLKILTDFDVYSKNTTTLDIGDGFHRMEGAYRAVLEANKQGKKLNGKLLLYIISQDTESAAAYIRRMFKRNEENPAYLETLDDTNTNKFIKLLSEAKNKEENIFYDNIAKTQQEKTLLNKITTYGAVTQALEYCDVKFTILAKMKQEANIMADIATQIYAMIEEQFKDKEIFKKDKINKSMSVALLLVIANILMKKENYIDLIIPVAEKMYGDRTWEKLIIKDNLFRKTNFIDNLMSYLSDVI